MDGIHLDGGCRRGRIIDLSGTTHDDLVALNADDVWCAQTCAEISDILVDGIRTDCAHSAVRMLSAPNPVRRVTIRNVFGCFYCYGIGFTQYRKSWSFSIYYALRNGCDYLDGVLGFGAKTLF